VSRLKITQTRSTIGALRAQRQTLRTLGLKRVRDATVREDDPALRGMIAVVSHLVSVEEVET
jgi:large subunit ribosomal protein L30